MTVTSNTIANQAIQLMGDNQPAVTGVVAVAVAAVIMEAAALAETVAQVL